MHSDNKIRVYGYNHDLAQSTSINCLANLRCNCLVNLRCKLRVNGSPIVPPNLIFLKILTLFEN